MSVGDAALMLARAGARNVTEADIRKDIEAGAPLNPDGTISLIHYGAWLVSNRGN